MFESHCLVPPVDVVSSVLGHPNSFTHLTELILSNVPLHDEDLLNLGRLPSLDTLNISNTCIGDEAIAYLLPLKSTLACLDISSNPRLTDDSCALLTFLTSLSFLDIRQTGVNMPGLRRFARSVDPVRWTLTIEVPDTCLEYLSGMQHQYAIKLPAPLITYPQDSKSLTIETLRSNLVVHAQCNPNISTGGSKMEMAQRLEDVLCRREDDLWVLDVMGWREDLDEELELDGWK
ncbi:hypothetical protein BS47DRAFT_1306288 [Hydnum rufescens UP504]|uniref:Uncharacterized protein n=1 Tax=Hydnum rufescens UP504 TaxID=1448309 RepID=A0A9P6AGX7_9AGAM|nr:hypothetical protein BS47DRAFT_1306288 [Hydnum rufescens UP504]